VTDLVLDPDDARDLGIRLARPEAGDYGHLNPPLRSTKYREAIDQACDRVCLDLLLRMGREAEQIAAAGLSISDVDMRVEPGEFVDGQYVMRVVGTLKIERWPA
jgi:hypothetical protein